MLRNGLRYRPSLPVDYIKNELLFKSVQEWNDFVKAKEIVVNDEVVMFK